MLTTYKLLHKLPRRDAVGPHSSLALDRGETIEEDGVRKWLTVIDVFDDANGYTQDAEGNVQAERTLCTLSDDGTLTREHLDFIWHQKA
jgi:hypothetical protein